MKLLAVVIALLGGRCPDGWALDGVRPSGCSTCSPRPPRGCGEPKGPASKPCPADDRRLPAGYYCTGGSIPVVVDDRTIGCQARH